MCQRMFVEMSEMGAVPERLAGHVIGGPSVHMGTLRTIRGMLYEELASVENHGRIQEGQRVCLPLSSGQLQIEPVPVRRPIRDVGAIVTELGGQLLDLHAFRKQITSTRPTPPLTRLLQEVADDAAYILGGARCCVILENDGVGRVRAVSRTIYKGRSASLSSEVLAWLSERDGSVRLADTSRRPRLGLASQGILSLMGVPLNEAGETRGWLCALHPTTNAFGDEDERLLRFFAQQAAIAIKNIQLYQHLQSQAADMEAILQGIGDGLVVVDPELRLVMANPTARELLSLGRDLTAGASLPDDSPLMTLLAQGHDESCFTGEIRLPKGEGEPLICQATISCIEAPDGQLEGLVAVLRDITEQREQERLKSTLLSVVSHELRTPLHSISGFVDIILMGKTGPLTDVQRDFLTTVRKQSAQLQNIINDLLEFSRLEYGQIKLTTEPVHIAEITRHVLQKLAVLAQEQGVALEKDMPGDLPAIEGDSVRLEQVLTNLVDNALKFTPRHGSITVGAADRGQEVEIWVQDTGVGITAEDQERIFEKFFQVDQGGRIPRKGAGLGLTICKHIVEQHQGHIWVESHTGQGSTFHLTLPKQLAEDELVLDFARLKGNESQVPSDTESMAALPEAQPMPEGGHQLLQQKRGG
jgi:signal transduction histidine kinase